MRREGLNRPRLAAIAKRAWETGRAFWFFGGFTPPALLPHPDGRNTQRAAAAASALDAFRLHTGADLEDAASDLLADLMHWCDRHGPGFAVELLRAHTHYAAETTDFTELAPRRHRD